MARSGQFWMGGWHPLTGHTTLAPGYSIIVDPYDQCYLRKDPTGQMRLMLVPLWSLREDQNELVVIPGHLSLATPLTTTGLHIADILIITAFGRDQMPGWIEAPEAEIPETAHPFWLQLGLTRGAKTSSVNPSPPTCSRFGINCHNLKA